MPPPESTRDIFAKFGATAVDSPTGPSVTPLDLQRQQEEDPEFAPQSRPKQDPVSFGDIAKKMGATVALPEPETPAPAEQGEKKVEAPLADLYKERAALEKEGINLRDNISKDIIGRKHLEDDWMDRWFENHNKETEIGLAQKLAKRGITPGYADQPQALRRLDEAFQRWGSTLMSATAWATGDKKTAMDVTGMVDDLSAYNMLLDRHSVLGKKYGPMMGQIGSSLANTTISVGTTGGLTGVAGMIGMDEWNRGMVEAKDKDPVDQMMHGATKSLIGTAITLAGGMLAQKAGVASAESIVPFFGKTSKELFSKIGMMKGSTAAVIEGGEEGLQALFGGIEDANAGTDPNAVENLWDNVLTSTAAGTFVGTITQATHSAGKYGLKAKHFYDSMQGWSKRLPKETETKVVDPDVDQYVADDKGGLVKKSTLNEEFEALSQLEEEINEQFESGGAVELQHLMSERRADVKGAEQELKPLIEERNKWAKSSSPKAASKVRFLNEQIRVRKEYVADVKFRLGEDRVRLEDWRKEFDTIHKQEKEYLDTELSRIAELRDRPPVTDKILEKLTRPEPKKEGETDGDKTPSKEAGDQTKAEEGTPAEAAGPAQETDTKVPDAVAPHPKKGESRGTDRPVFNDIDNSLRKNRQRDLNKVREFLGFDKVGPRDEHTTRFDFQEADRLGLDDGAMGLAQEVLEDGKILNSVELAGLGIRYFDKLGEITKTVKFIENNPDMATASYDSRVKEMEEAVQEIGYLSEAWIRTSSEAGAALQAQQRVNGVLYSAKRAVIAARRNKKADLTADEISKLVKVSERVQEATENMIGLERGTKEYDVADEKLYLAQLEHQATIANHTPGVAIMDNVEAFNALRMALTLGGDLVPHGRQLYLPQFMNPKLTAQNIPKFYKTFLNKTPTASEHEAFKIERTLREMENFHVLTKKYGVPMMERNTPFSQVEGHGISRIHKVLKKSKIQVGGRKLSNVEHLPLAQFDIAYRTMLNQTRLTMADWVYRTNKDVLKLPGGEREMQAMIDFTMNATGHTKADLGKYGRLAITAPRWMLSRMAIPAKGVYHISRLGVAPFRKDMDTEASKWIARQYVKFAAGHLVWTGMLTGIAALFFGKENVSMTYDPFSKTAGMLQAGGRTYAVSGGLGFTVRQAAKFVKGLTEMVRGKDRDPDADFGQSVGGTLSNRFTGLGRDIGYAFQSGKPLGENERMGIVEYILRASSYLTAQEIIDAANTEGFGQAVFSALMELNGHSGFDRKG